MSEQLDIDLDKFSLNEVIELEELTGKNALEFEKGNVTPKDLRFLVFLIKRRDNPELTVEDAGEIKISALSPPTKVARKRPTNRGKS